MTYRTLPPTPELDDALNPDVLFEDHVTVEPVSALTPRGRAWMRRRVRRPEFGEAPFVFYFDRPVARAMRSEMIDDGLDVLLLFARPEPAPAAAPAALAKAAAPRTAAPVALTFELQPPAADGPWWLSAARALLARVRGLLTAWRERDAPTTLGVAQ